MKAKLEMELEERAKQDAVSDGEEETGSLDVVDRAKKNIETNTQYKLTRRIHMTKQEEEDEMAQIGIK